MHYVLRTRVIESIYIYSFHDELCLLYNVVSGLGMGNIYGFYERRRKEKKKKETDDEKSVIHRYSTYRGGTSQCAYVGDIYCIYTGTRSLVANPDPRDSYCLRGT